MAAPPPEPPVRFVIFVGEIPIEIELTKCSPTVRLALRDLAAEARLLVSALPPSCSGAVPMLP